MGRGSARTPKVQGAVRGTPREPRGLYSGDVWPSLWGLGSWAKWKELTVSAAVSFVLKVALQYSHTEVLRLDVM